MKLTFCLMMLLLSTVLSMGQANLQSGGSPVTPDTLAAHRAAYTTAYLYYGNNVATQYKEYTQGRDIFSDYPDFPRYADSGNLVKDITDYRARVHAWVKVHEDFAKKFNINIKNIKD